MKKLSLLFLLTASSVFAMQSQLSQLIGKVKDPESRAVFNALAQEIGEIQKHLGIKKHHESSATTAAPYSPSTAAALIPAASQPAKIVPAPIASASGASGATAAPVAATVQPTGQVSPRIQRVIEMIDKMNIEKIPYPPDDTNPNIKRVLEVLKTWKEQKENIDPAVKALKKKLAEIGAKKSWSNSLYHTWLSYNNVDARSEEGDNFKKTLPAGILTEADFDDIFKTIIL